MAEKKIHEHQHLLRIRTLDDFLMTALMVLRAHEKKKEIFDIPVLVQIHGLLGHFLARGTPRLLPHALLEHGFNSLSINTRLAFAGQMTSRGVFDDTVHDVDAAVEYLVHEGFKNIFILGYSLGAGILVHWASKRELPNVRGIILEGCHYSFPDSKKRLYAKWGSSPTWDDIYERAKAVLGDDPYASRDDETFVAYRCRGPDRTPLSDEIFTCKSWWFMVGPEAHNGMAYKHIGRVKVPILFVRGEDDFLVEDWEPEALARIAREAGNPSVKVRAIPGARHDCMENADVFLKEIVAMLSTCAGRGRK